MELEFQTRPLSFLRRTVDGTCHQELTQELIVPDASPDAVRVVYCTAQPILRSRTCQNGTIQLSGGVQAAALYLTDADSLPRMLDAYLPFTLRLDHPSAAEQTQLFFDCRVCAASARLVHSRKLLFQIDVGAQIFGFEPSTADLPALQDPPAALEVQCRTYPLPLPAELAEKTFQLTDTLSLPAAQPAIGTILSVTALPSIAEQRLVGSKAVFKGSVELNILYLDPDGAPALFAPSLPFSQYCPLSADYEDADLQLLTALTGCEVTLQPDSAQPLQISLHLLAQCLITETHSCTFCEDAYATSGTLEASWSEFTFPTCLDRRTKPLPLRAALSGAPLRSILASSVLPAFPQPQSTGEHTTLALPCQLQVLGLDEAGALCGLTGSAQPALELPLCQTASCLATAALCPGSFASPAATGAEVRADFSLHICAAANQTFRTLSGGSLTPADPSAAPRPSLVIRSFPTSVPVWDVARHYHTRVSAIQTANSLSADDIAPGTLLLIPI